MEYTQAMDILNLMDLEQSIRWYLQHNHYPPVSIEMIPVAIKAIILCRENKFDETIVTFFEHQLFGWKVPARAIVEAYPLADPYHSSDYVLFLGAFYLGSQGSPGAALHSPTGPFGTGLGPSSVLLPS
jgi:hypothetical protein